MSAPDPRNRANALAIIAGGGFAGCSLFIGLSLGSRWLAMDPLAWQAAFWPAFVGFAFTVVPLYLSSVVGIVWSMRLDGTTLAARRWWRIALALWLVNFVMTAGYFIPENLNFRAEVYDAVGAASARVWWLSLHAVRIVLAFVMVWASMQAVFGVPTIGHAPTPVAPDPVLDPLADAATLSVELAAIVMSPTVESDPALSTSTSVTGR